MNGGPWLEEVVVIAGVLALAGLLAWLGFRYAFARLELRRERERTLREVLARMESPERAAAFLASDAGRALLGEPDPEVRRRAILLSLLGLSAFSGALGAALLVTAFWTATPGAGEPEVGVTWGAVLVALSAAALLVAGGVHLIGLERPRGAPGPGGDG